MIVEVILVVLSLIAYFFGAFFIVLGLAEVVEFPLRVLSLGLSMIMAATVPTIYFPVFFKTFFFFLGMFSGFLAAIICLVPSPRWIIKLKSKIKFGGVNECKKRDS